MQVSTCTAKSTRVAIIILCCLGYLGNSQIFFPTDISEKILITATFQIVCQTKKIVKTQLANYGFS
jgi:hypothetical protein